jgi:uncharacterized membrane protein YfbV (UPF0208 family)
LLDGLNVWRRLVEFRLSKLGEKVTCEFTVGEVTVTEVVPDEATWSQDEMFKYCTRRLQALEDSFKRQGRKEYKELAQDLNKAFEIRDNVLVEKASGKPVLDKRS